MADPTGTAERCARCAAPFRCGMRAGDATPCWCTELPSLEPVAGRSCLCRECLEAELAKAKRPSASL
jgi:hypothetical protein